MNFIEALQYMEKGGKIAYANETLATNYFYMEDGVVYHHSLLGDKVATIELGYFSGKKFAPYTPSRKKISGYDALEYMLKGGMVFEIATDDVYKIINGNGLSHKYLYMDEWSPTYMDINVILERTWEIETDGKK